MRSPEKPFPIMLLDKIFLLFLLNYNQILFLSYLPNNYGCPKISSAFFFLFSRSFAQVFSQYSAVSENVNKNGAKKLPSPLDAMTCLIKCLDDVE